MEKQAVIDLYNDLSSKTSQIDLTQDWIQPLESIPDLSDLKPAFKRPSTQFTNIRSKSLTASTNQRKQDSTLSVTQHAES